MGKGYLIEKRKSLSSVNIEKMPTLKIILMTHGKRPLSPLYIVQSLIWCQNQRADSSENLRNNFSESNVRTFYWHFKTSKHLKNFREQHLKLYY